MSFELAPGTLLNSRYQIKKVIAFGEDGGVYLARDLKVTDRNWIVKEIIPSSTLDDEALATRKALFVEAVESIMQFDHAGLSRILDYFSEARREYVVMEYVEGVILQTLCDMSVNPLPEKQILGWALQMCDALSYLHNRPKPFIFHAMSPGHIILTSDEQVKLINYGLDRFFTAATPPKVFTDSPGDILKEFARFGETMCFLLTKEKPGAFGLPAGANTSPELTKVINRCLQGESQKTYTSFEDLKRSLDQVLHPPEVPRKKEEPAVTRSAQARLPPEWQEHLLTMLERFLSQRREFLVAEAGAAMVLLVGLWIALHPYAGTYSKASGSVVYLATDGGQLVALQMDTRLVVDKKTLSGPAGDIIADPRGGWLYIADRQNNRITRMDTSSDSVPESHGFIPVDRAPGRMLIDAKGLNMYVVHDTTHNVSRVNLSRDPPQMESIVAVGTEPRDLALTQDGQTLFVSNFRAETVTAVQPETNKTLATIDVGGGPGALAMSPDGTQLWVACETIDTVAIIDVATLKKSENLADISGKKPVAIAFSADGSKAFVANNGSNNIAVIDVSTRKVLRTITTPPGPLRLVRTPDTLRLLLICSGRTGVTIIDTQSDRATGEIEAGARPTAEAITPN